jgi:hypothetical protein
MQEEAGITGAGSKMANGAGEGNRTLVFIHKMKA